MVNPGGQRLNSQNESYERILARIKEGTIIINEREKFEHLLKLFPEKASLHRAFADFLAKEGARDEAVRVYERSAKMYLDSGRSLQAIVATILAWSINKPTHDQGRVFHAAVQASKSAETPLQDFFSAFTYPELVAVMLRLVRVHFPANHAVKSFGDEANELFFIVSGTLKETTYRTDGDDESGDQALVRHLSDNDIFGDIYPLDAEHRSRSDVETLTHVELVKISKQVLQQLCRKHPRVELLLTDLYRNPSETLDGRMWTSVRRAVRYEIPTKVKLSILPQMENAPPIDTEGLTRDISLGGACVDVGDQHLATPLKAFENAAVNVEIRLTGENVTLKIAGNIAWSVKFIENANTRLLVGIRFEALNDSERRALEKYCLQGNAEQNLLWNLWDDLVKG